jgi:hypothetical protein
VADEVKGRCRRLAAAKVAPGSYLAAHAGASRSETLNLVRVLLSPNNLRQLRRRRAAGARAELLAWLAECRAACGREHIDLADICVVGSSPLELIGVRPSTDVDFTLRSGYRRARYGSGVTALAPSVDIVTEGYHRSRGRPAVADDDLIDNPDHHFVFRGIKFANPEIVLDMKDFYRRDKDVRDLELAGAATAGASFASFDPAFEFASRCETLLRDLTMAPPSRSDAPSGGGLRRALTRLRARMRSTAGRGPRP